MKTIKKVIKPIVYYAKNPKRLLEKDEIHEAMGIKFHCRMENLIERMIAERGSWEPWETKIAKDYIKPANTVLDIGANIGYFTLLFAQLVGPNGRVHAFEPTRYAADRLRANIDLNPSLAANIEVNHCGLSASAGTRHESIEARFSARVAAYSEAEEIEFVTLNEYSLSKMLTDIDFIKIDVDGHDFDVLRSGRAFIERCDALLLAELNGPALASFGVSTREYLDLIEAAGYTKYLSDDNDSWGSLKNIWNDIPDLEHRSINALFSKDL